MAVGQNQWYHFRVGAPLILIYFKGDWDVHWGYGRLTHGQVFEQAEGMLVVRGSPGYAGNLLQTDACTLGHFAA